jgi:hypothetical protein
MRIFLWALHIYKAQHPDTTIACLVAISLVLKRPNHLAGCQHQNEQKESGRHHAKNTADTDAYLCAHAPRTPYQHCTDNIGVHARSGARIWRECLLSPLHTSRCGQSKRTYPAGETPELDIYMRIFLWAVRIHYTHHYDTTMAHLVAVSLVLKRPTRLFGCQHPKKQKGARRHHAKNTADKDAYLCALAPCTPCRRCIDNIGVHARSWLSNLAKNASGEGDGEGKCEGEDEGEGEG